MSNPITIQAKEFWQARNARERGLLVGFVVLLVLLIWYTALWQPLSAAAEQHERNIARQEVDLAWMTGAAQELQQTRATGQVLQGAGQSVLSIVDLASKSAKLKAQMNNLTSVNQNTARATFENASFDQLLRFIYQLNYTYGVVVSNLNIDRKSAAGLVDARLTLTRP